MASPWPVADVEAPLDGVVLDDSTEFWGIVTSPLSGLNSTVWPQLPAPEPNDTFYGFSGEPVGIPLTPPTGYGFSGTVILDIKAEQEVVIEQVAIGVLGRYTTAIQEVTVQQGTISPTAQRYTTADQLVTVQQQADAFSQALVDAIQEVVINQAANVGIKAEQEVVINQVADAVLQRYATAVQLIDVQQYANATRQPGAYAIQEVTVGQQADIRGDFAVTALQLITVQQLAIVAGEALPPELQTWAGPRRVVFIDREPREVI